MLMKWFGLESESLFGSDEQTKVSCIASTNAIDAAVEERGERREGGSKTIGNEGRLDIL